MDQCVPAQVTKQCLELRGLPQHLDRPMQAAIFQPSMDDASLFVDPVLAPFEVPALVHEEDSAVGGEQALQEAPERLEPARRHVRQEDPKKTTSKSCVASSPKASALR